MDDSPPKSPRHEGSEERGSGGSGSSGIETSGAASAAPNAPASRARARGLAGPAPAGATVLDRLMSSGWQFDFFQATWLLEQAEGEHEAVGCRGPVARELFRFRPAVSMGFPATDVRRIARRDEPETGQPVYEVEVTFLGLYGVSSPLPLHYAVDVLREVDARAALPPAEGLTTKARRPADSTPTRDFLDVLHHRLLSLFYRAWLKYRYERQYALRGRDALTGYLLCLIGCPRPARAGSVHDPRPARAGRVHAPRQMAEVNEATPGLTADRMIRYAGLLTQHPKSACTLEGLLVDYWGGLDARVEQCVGRWVTISTADLNAVGTANSGIGMNLNLGEEIYDLNGAFNVVLGPVDWDTFQLFLPDGEAFAQTKALVELYCTDPLSFTIEVKLHPNEVPPVYLGTDPKAGRLGYTSWLRTGDVPETSVVFSTTLGPAAKN